MHFAVCLVDIVVPEDFLSDKGTRKIMISEDFIDGNGIPKIINVT